MQVQAALDNYDPVLPGPATTPVGGAEPALPGGGTPTLPEAGVPGAPVVVGGGTPLPEAAAPAPSTLAGLLETPTPHAPVTVPAATPGMPGSMPAAPGLVHQVLNGGLLGGLLRGGAPTAGMPTGAAPHLPSIGQAGAPAHAQPQSPMGGRPQPSAPPTFQPAPHAGLQQVAPPGVPTPRATTQPQVGAAPGQMPGHAANPPPAVSASVAGPPAAATLPRAAASPAPSMAPLPSNAAAFARQVGPTVMNGVQQALPQGHAPGAATTTGQAAALAQGAAGGMPRSGESVGSASVTSTSLTSGPAAQAARGALPLERALAGPFASAAGGQAAMPNHASAANAANPANGMNAAQRSAAGGPSGLASAGATLAPAFDPLAAKVQLSLLRAAELQGLRGLGLPELPASWLGAAQANLRTPAAEDAWLRSVNASLVEVMKPAGTGPTGPLTTTPGGPAHSGPRQAGVLPEGGLMAATQLAASTGNSAAVSYLAALQAAGAQAARDSARETVAVPAQVSSLQTDAVHLHWLLDIDVDDDEAWHEGPKGAWETDEHEGEDPRDGQLPADEDEPEVIEPELLTDDDIEPLAHVTAAIDAAADAAPGYAPLATLLAQAGQHAALRELELGRRVLLLMPSADEAGQARVHLLGLDRASRGQVQSFAARWTPGPWRHAGAVAPGWTHWRLHQEAGRGAWPLLQTSASARANRDEAARPCLLRLGAQPATLQDARTACLDIPDAARFMRTLGAQWSLMVVLAVEGQA